MNKVLKTYIYSMIQKMESFKKSLQKRQVQQKKTNLKQNKIILGQILQVTEEYQTYRQNINHDQLCIIQKKKSVVNKYLNCLQHFCYNIFKKEALVEVDVNQSQLSKLIYELKNKKDNLKTILPPLKDNKKTLVLDLDQTLIYTTFTKPKQYDFQLEIQINNQPVICYTTKRFGLDNFLFEISQLYEIVVFTAGKRLYAEKVISKIDPKGWINYKLYQQHCIVINKIHYLKNLRILGRNMNNVIIVDDNRMGGILQPDNYYHIQSFNGNSKDRKLVRLGAFLKYLCKLSNMRPVKSYKKKFQSMQINLKQNMIIDKIITQQQKRKVYGHKKINSQNQSLTSKQQNQNIYQITSNSLKFQQQ